jgi:hypothetical protein
MIQVNPEGLRAIRAYLLHSHKHGGDLNDIPISAWAACAAKDDRAEIELKSSETVSGQPEDFEIPPDGFDLSLTIDEFEDWANHATWSFFEDGQFGDQDIEVGCEEDGQAVFEPHGVGSIWKTGQAIHTNGKLITVTYQCAVNWEGTVRERFKEEHTLARPGGSETWTVIGLKLLDSDFEPLQGFEMEHALDICGGKLAEFRNIKVLNLIPPVVDEQIEIESEQQEFVVERHNSSNITFHGD